MSQRTEANPIKRKNLAFFLIGVILIAISIWQIAAAQAGLEIIQLSGDDPPVTVISRSGIPPASRPTVLIAHGFGGSAVIMRGFALTLAHAGYTTVSWDFEGHGANPNPLRQSSESDDLLLDAESALAQADAAGLIDTQHVAILGHSMGSGVALSYGVIHPDTYATIAISPAGQSVSPTLPHNLLLMAGSLEAQFVNNAKKLLAMAGGEGGDLTAGTARKLMVVPNVEHISILFSPTAHSTARLWLDGTFGPQSRASNYVDRRMLWFVLGIAGSVCLSFAVLNSLPVSQGLLARRPLWFRLIAMLVGGVAASLILWLVSLVGVSLSQMLGLLVGGYMIVWFGIAGAINLLILRSPLRRPSITELIKALIAFGALWLGVGLLGNFVWIPWLLIPSRLALWIPASVITLPWFLSVGQAASQSRPLSQVGWWLAQVIVIVASLILTLRLNPELGFIFLILPVIPIMLALQSLVISPRHGPWGYALPGAMFTAWLLLAVFPLQ